MSLDRLSAILTEALTITEALKTVPAPIPPSPDSGPVNLYAGALHEYSTMYPGNIDHRAFLLQHPQGAIGLHYADGKLFKMLPSFVSSSSQPRWSRKKPTVFRYLYLNELREFDVANDQSMTLRKFKEFPNINGMGESDTSEDDDHIVLCSGLKVFVYQMSKDKIVQEFTADGTFDNLYLTSVNEPVVGYHGIGHVLHRRNGKVMLTNKNVPHMDTSSDSSGDPVVVFSDGTRSKAAVVKADINSGGRTDLLQFDWSLAIHISLPDRAPFAIVTTYDPKNPASTVKYANEILRVWLDSVNGSHVQSLGKHGSNADIYQRQPKASVSPDATRIVYDSNGSVYVMAA